MYVYSDIVKLSPVGNSQVPIMGFLSIKSKFQESGNWVFNPPMYVSVREKNIKTITLKIFTETGEEFLYSKRCDRLSPQLLPPIIFGLDLYKEPRLQLWSFVNFKTIDLRIEFDKASCLERGNGFDIPVFRVTSRYQYGQNLGDVCRGIVRFISKMAQFLTPVAIKGAQTLLKADSKAIKEGSTIKDVIKSTLKPTVVTVLGATVDQVASKLIEIRNNQ